MLAVGLPGRRRREARRSSSRLLPASSLEFGIPNEVLYIRCLDYCYHLSPFSFSLLLPLGWLVCSLVFFA